MGLKRTTFSESWYRVAELKPTMHPSLKVWRQTYRGELWFVLEDPVNNVYFRIPYPAYEFLALLNGKKTVSEVWHAALEIFGDEAPTQGEVIQLLGQLYNSNLLLGDIPADSQGLLKRHKQRIQKEITGQIRGFLFLKIPFLDPDRFLKALMPLVGWMFSSVGLVLWILAAVLGIIYSLGSIDVLIGNTSSVLAPENLVLLYAGFAISKILHEFGHAFACKRFGLKSGSGGQVHKMGVMLMILTPVPFVDCSSSWAFRSKWQRMLVGMAGMLVDLGVASISIIVWSQTAEGSTLHALAYNIMFVTSVSTLVFNGNPLMRYDAYYILSDFLEIPNLSSRSNSYVFYLCRKYVLGAKEAQMQTGGKRERFWLFVYSISAFLYRTIVMFGIALFLADQLFLFGVLFGIALTFRLFLKPIWTYLKYLFADRELRYCRQRAFAVTGFLLLTFLFILGVQPLPDRIRIEGVVEPMELSSVYTKVEGFLKSASVEQQVEAGQTLFELTNKNLETILKTEEIEIKRLKLEYRQARYEDLVKAQVLLKQIDTLEESLKNTILKRQGLIVKATNNGLWHTEDLKKKIGSYLRKGTEVGRLCSENNYLIRAVASQEQVQLLDTGNKYIEMRVKGRPGQFMKGDSFRKIPVGLDYLPSAALGYIAGGVVETKSSDSSGRQTREKFFEVQVTPDQNDMKNLLPGQIIVIRFELKPKSLASQLWRAVKQQFQKRFRII